MITSTASSKRPPPPPAESEAGEFVVPVALADPEIEPAARQQIERRRLLRQQHRVVPRQHHHRGAEPQRGRRFASQVSRFSVAEIWSSR